MDRISKFRRKPKPPAIETSVVRSRSTEPPHETDSNADSLHPGRNSRMSGRISPFRNIRLLSSGKRARSSPPAGTHLSHHTTAAVVAKDGHPLRNLSSRDGTEDENGNTTPKIPRFLTCSPQEIQHKYHELVWAERNRVADGMRNDTVQNYKWGSFKQTDAPERGLMDRYANVRPWNHNRIKLKVPEDEFDYVNASEITLPTPTDPTQQPLRYIAMQGPTAPSFDYVWRMIAEQLAPTAAIIQLTSMVEGGATKCHQYFPFQEEYSQWVLNQQDIWGDGWKAELTFDSMEQLADGAIEKRKLLLHVEGEAQPRTIWHFLYLRWPDFGVPDLEDVDSFFELMSLSRDYGDADGVRIVHCSAGVGRTGTFISIEHLMRELESGAFDGSDTSHGSQDAVYNIVDLLRQQRRGMVQGAPQYTFIYAVIRKLWLDKYGLTDEQLATLEPAAKRLEVPIDPFIDTDDDTISTGARTPGGPEESSGGVRLDMTS